MEIAGPVIDLINHVWDCSGRRTSYLCNLRENLDALKDATEELKNRRDEVKGRVEMAEAQRMVRTPIVRGWLQRVEAVEAEVDAILQQGSRQIEERCLRGCCPKNCWTSYKFGKKVVKKLSVVNELKDKGKFDEVANRLQGVSVQPVPENPTVGMESIFEKALKLLQDDDVRIMGLYGIGGVGKTTLLKKINNNFSIKRSHDVDVVIWVVVSKELNLGRIQNEIGKKLGFSWEGGNELSEERAEAIFNMLSRKKFLLLLDDCWERVDLQRIGIPHPQVGKKVVFTTRSEMVCGQMEANKKIRVNCLDPKKAWDLFREKVGEEALNLHPEIPGLAACVAKECGGLPLALITVGRTMASKKTRQEWKHALTVLKKSASEFSGMGDEVFPLLKFSYDNLKDDAHKSCFLYCCLYPEDRDISKDNLIKYWIGEGFLDGFENKQEAYNKGYDIIGNLTAVCLLETGNVDDDESCVKMHDVIRDLAMWIGCECGRKKNKFLVQAGVNLSKAPPFDQWKEAERVSLMRNDIKSLEVSPILFNNLLTLNLADNWSLSNISDDFFQSMPTLKVLDLQKATIAHLPRSISYLVALQYLDLSSTSIENLPDEFVKLVNLKFLDLSYIHSLRIIPRGMISCLSKLQYLNLFESGFKIWGFDGDCDGHATSLMELESLEHLNTLGLSVKSTLALQKLAYCNKLQMCVEFLGVSQCEGLISLILSSSSSSSSLVSTMTSICLGSIKNLKRLSIEGCLLEEVMINGARVEEETGQVNHDFLSNLKVLQLTRLTTYPCLHQLDTVIIGNCDKLIDLTWLLFAPSLKGLHVDHCKKLAIIVDVKGVAATAENLNPFSRLKVFDLVVLPNLRLIVEGALPFPALGWMFVSSCPKLKKLPFDSNSAQNTLQSIYGSSEWWEELEWGDETIKSSFLPYFKATVIDV